MGLGLELRVLELGLLLKLERVLVSKGVACFEVEWHWRWDGCWSWGGVRIEECYWRWRGWSWNEGSVRVRDGVGYGILR